MKRSFIIEGTSQLIGAHFWREMALVALCAGILIGAML